MAAQPQREWFEKDYYKVLGVPETATDKEIRRAYRKLAKEHHPDSNPGHEDRFKEISAAYDVLSDDEKRKAYDEVRRLGPMAGGFGPGAGGFGTGGPGAGGYTFTTEDLGDLGGLGDLFGNLFGGGGRRRGQTVGPRRGDDLETELHLSSSSTARARTCSSPLPSRSPRPPSVPRSRCRPSTAARSRCVSRPGRARGAPSGSRAAAFRSARAQVTCSSRPRWRCLRSSR